MPPELKAAYLFAQSTAAFIQCQSMIAENQERQRKNLAQAYDEAAFYELAHNLHIEAADLLTD